MTVPDPGALMGEIHALAVALDKGQRELSAAIRELGEVEAEYERAFNRELLVIRDDAVRRGERVPAEDLRRAMAHSAIAPELYARYLRARAAVDAGRAWLRATEAGLSARQSLLSAFKAEGAVR